MEDTDNDSVLMLRQMYLTSLAYKGLGQLTVPQVGSSFLELECSKSPSAARCSSIWVTRAYVQCVDVPASGVSEAETGSEPKVRPANACWPAFSLRDWRLLSPGLLGEGSLGRLGGRWVSRGAMLPQRLQGVPLGKGWPLLDPASSAPGTG